MTCELAYYERKRAEEIGELRELLEECATMINGLARWCEYWLPEEAKERGGREAYQQARALLERIATDDKEDEPPGDGLEQAKQHIKNLLAVLARNPDAGAWKIEKAAEEFLK